MINILWALGCGAAVFAFLFAPGWLSAGEALVPAILVILVAYVLFARRTFRAVEAVVREAALSLQSIPPKLDLAIATLQKAYPFGRQQIGVRSQIDSQIGMIYFLQKEFSKALPYLERAQRLGHWTGTAMLAVIYYKKKDITHMRSTMDAVVKRAKRQSLAWNLYAYLLCQIGEDAAAQKILIEGLKQTKDDVRVRESLTALQNGKKIKMRGYKEQWYQFHLERPPMEQHGMPMGGRVSKAARRGRW